jgi:deoxyribodipyrimidine photo-lyase
VLLTEEDLHPESWGLEVNALGVAALASPVVGDPDSAAARFGRGALDDGLARADGRFGPAAGVLGEDAVVAWAKALGARELLTGYAPTGLIAWSLDRLKTRLGAEGIRLVRHLRPYDARLWPHASAGFLKVKVRIPDLVAGLLEPRRA